MLGQTVMIRLQRALAAPKRDSCSGPSLLSQLHFSSLYNPPNARLYRAGVQHASSLGPVSGRQRALPEARVSD